MARDSVDDFGIFLSVLRDVCHDSLSVFRGDGSSSGQESACSRGRCGAGVGWEGCPTGHGAWVTDAEETRSRAGVRSTSCEEPGGALCAPLASTVCRRAPMRLRRGVESKRPEQGDASHAGTREAGNQARAASKSRRCYRPLSPPLQSQDGYWESWSGTGRISSEANLHAVQGGSSGGAERRRRGALQQRRARRRLQLAWTEWSCLGGSARQVPDYSVSRPLQERRPWPAAVRLRNGARGASGGGLGRAAEAGQEGHAGSTQREAMMLRLDVQNGCNGQERDGGNNAGRRESVTVHGPRYERDTTKTPKRQRL
ncbi:hypothetical protein IQ07DRAFT_585128 [Pyrenochaeta sp. DS3sAY3a]|nr:hypothetical protein IQ07DRAFT_585128 [Pyrenochaeta sp. DS3sAY3a]